MAAATNTVVQGPRYVLPGVVLGRFDFVSEKDQKRIMGVKIGWLGSQCNFRCENSEEMERFPQAGSPVHLEGPLLMAEGKPPKMVLEIVEVPGAKSQKSL